VYWVMSDWGLVWQRMPLEVATEIVAGTRPFATPTDMLDVQLESLSDAQLENFIVSGMESDHSHLTVSRPTAPPASRVLPLAGFGTQALRQTLPARTLTPEQVAHLLGDIDPRIVHAWLRASNVPALLVDAAADPETSARVADWIDDGVAHAMQGQCARVADFDPRALPRFTDLFALDNAHMAPEGDLVALYLHPRPLL